MATLTQAYQAAQTHRSERSTTSRFDRWAPIAGITFVVLMVVGSMLIGDVPDPDAPVKQITAYLADGANHTRNLIGAYLSVIGSLAFLWFLVRLRNDIRNAEGGNSPLSNLAFAAGMAFAAVWTVSAAAFAALPYAIEVRNAPITDPELVRVLPALGRLLLLHGGGFAGLLVLVATSTAILQTSFLPRWLGWLGIAAAIVLLVDVIYLTIFPFWTWVLIASIVMLVRHESPN
jgi:hypothetical protein